MKPAWRVISEFDFDLRLRISSKMKTLYALVLVAIIAVAYAAEEKKEEGKELEKKPIEKVVWPGLYSPWVHAPVRPIQLIHQPVVYQPAHGWYY